MIRGVNKHIIEVNNTENDYFEKAILFVNPDKASAQSKEIMDVANTYLKGMAQVHKTKKQTNKLLMNIIRFSSVFGLGVAVATFVLYYL